MTGAQALKADVGSPQVARTHRVLQKPAPIRAERGACIGPVPGQLSQVSAPHRVKPGALSLRGFVVRLALGGAARALHWTVHHGSDSMIAYMQSLAPERFSDELAAAVRRNDRSFVQRMLAVPGLTSTNGLGSTGETPLFVAAILRNEEMVRLFVSDARTLDVPTTSGRYAYDAAWITSPGAGASELTRMLGPLSVHRLTEPARAGDVQALNAVLANPTAATLLNVPDRRGFTALHHAAWAGHTEIIDALASRADVVDSPDLQGRYSHDLARERVKRTPGARGNAKLLQLTRRLLEFALGLPAPSRTGSSQLFKAVRNMNVEAIRQLHADPTLRDPDNALDLLLEMMSDRIRDTDPDALEMLRLLARISHRDEPTPLSRSSSGQSDPDNFIKYLASRKEINATVLARYPRQVTVRATDLWSRLSPGKFFRDTDAVRCLELAEGYEKGGHDILVLVKSVLAAAAKNPAEARTAIEILKALAFDLGPGPPAARARNVLRRKTAPSAVRTPPTRDPASKTPPPAVKKSSTVFIPSQDGTSHGRTVLRKKNLGTVAPKPKKDQEERAEPAKPSTRSVLTKKRQRV